MTENRRIILNIVATYGRSIYALLLGLFSARWILEALGISDYGLYGLLAGLTGFIAFFNSLLAGAVGRFYAYSVGAARAAENQDAAIEECRKWFNTALSIHTALPIVLMIVGWPLGWWAIGHWLEIDPAKINQARVVFCFVCVSCFVGMINVPFAAMYTAKQYIAELTIYGIAQSTVNFGFLFYMVMNPGQWLVRYAAWACVVSIVPQLLICVRALCLFPECRFRWEYMWNRAQFKSLGSYAGWHLFGAVGSMLRSQGIQVLVNKYFGTALNASMSVANNVNGQTQALASAMQTAFTPAIVQACGARDFKRMRALAYRACKFSMLLSLVFTIPLSAEIDNVMRLWLKTPPDSVAGLCLCMMGMLIVDKSAVGHMIALNANGKIALYQSFLGTVVILTLPLAWLFVWLGWGVYSIGLAMMLTIVVCALGRVWLARRLVAMSVRHWAFRIILPIACVSVLAFIAAKGLTMGWRPSFARVIFTTLAAETVFLPMVWFFVLSTDEREYVRSCLKKIVRRK